MYLLNQVPSTDQTLVSFVNGVGFATTMNCHTDDGADGAIHARSITAGGEDGDTALLSGFDGSFGRSHRVEDAMVNERRELD
jgi:hypothetical protein